MPCHAIPLQSSNRAERIMSFAPEQLEGGLTTNVLQIETHHLALLLSKVQIEQPLSIVSGASQLLERIRPDGFDGVHQRESVIDVDYQLARTILCGVGELASRIKHLVSLSRVPN